MNIYKRCWLREIQKRYSLVTILSIASLTYLHLRGTGGEDDTSEYIHTAVIVQIVSSHWSGVENCLHLHWQSLFTKVHLC
jgi:hypothetical protein